MAGGSRAGNSLDIMVVGFATLDWVPFQKARASRNEK
jgi:hypothetical protein